MILQKLDQLWIGIGNWARAISTLLIEILNTVFRSILEFPDARAVIEGIRRLFTMESFAESAYCLHQTDIAGIYNQVQHSRIFDATEYVVYMYAQKTEQGLDTVLQAHILGTLSQSVSRSLERQIKTIFFCYIETHSCYCSIYLLDNSYFMGAKYFDNVGEPVWDLSLHLYFVQPWYSVHGTIISLFHPSLGIVRCIIDMWTIAFY